MVFMWQGMTPLHPDQRHCDAGVALDVFSYSALIKGFVQSSQLDTALEILTDMKTVNNVKPNEVYCACVCLRRIS